ncbi:hypothetical protein TNCV_2297281 [Trichonephila clavipes]|nr:hypothetical protein TNCV_2297281 [Trichonephila clavipes]
MSQAWRGLGKIKGQLTEVIRDREPLGQGAYHCSPVNPQLPIWDGGTLRVPFPSDAQHQHDEGERILERTWLVSPRCDVVFGNTRLRGKRSAITATYANADYYLKSSKEVSQREVGDCCHTKLREEKVETTWVQEKGSDEPI